MQLDREKAAWAKNEDEIRDLWRKRVKNDWLRLKLAGKDDKSIRETLDKRYDNYVNRIRKLNNEDVFQMFMNAYATAIEPHTNYLGPRSADNFDIAMRLSLEGIGAVLQTRDDYTIIREIVPGSPADKSGKLKVGDPNEPDTLIGPIINQSQFDGLWKRILDARNDGVRQIVGGEPEGLVLPPHVFADVAKANSSDGSAASGGDLGWFGPGAMVKPFEDAVIAAKIGEVTGPIKTDFGWHLILVTETRTAPVPTLADLHDELAAQIQKDAIAAFITAVTDKATITRSKTVIDPALIKDLTLLNK
jgi:hypothetical protein